MDNPAGLKIPKNVKKTSKMTKTNLIAMDILNSQDIGPPAYIISTRSICSYEDYLGYFKKSNKIGQDCN